MFQPHHYSTPTAAPVLNFTSKFRLAINCYVLRKPVVNPVSTLSIPAGNRFIGTYEIGLREIRFSVRIEVVDRPIDKQPPV
jgi:hypothetical protein